MTPTLSSWLNSTEPAAAGTDFDIAHIMARLGQSITFRRGSGSETHTVIVSSDESQAREVNGQAESSGQKRLILIGYRDYPGKTDFTVEPEDRFAISDTVYRITYIDDTIVGRREATAESTQ